MARRRRKHTRTRHRRRYRHNPAVRRHRSHRRRHVTARRRHYRRNPGLGGGVVNTAIQAAKDGAGVFAGKVGSRILTGLIPVPSLTGGIVGSGVQLLVGVFGGKFVSRFAGSNFGRNFAAGAAADVYEKLLGGALGSISPKVAAALHGYPTGAMSLTGEHYQIDGYGDDEAIGGYPQLSGDDTFDTSLMS